MEEVLCEDCRFFDEYNGYCFAEDDYLSSVNLACDRFEEIEEDVDDKKGN